MCWFYSNQCIAFSWHRTKSVLSLTCLWRSVRIPLRVRCFISLPSMFIQFHLFTQDQRQAMDVLIYLPAKCITYWFCQKFRKLTTDCKTQKLRGHLRGLDLLGKYLGDSWPRPKRRLFFFRFLRKVLRFRHRDATNTTAKRNITLQSKLQGQVKSCISLLGRNYRRGKHRLESLCW